MNIDPDDPPDPFGAIDLTQHDAQPPDYRGLSSHALLLKILESQHRLEKTMADIATDISDLVAATTSITADVAAVLAALKAAPNLTPDQKTSLEGAVSSLQQVDAQLKAAVPPAPPAPNP